MNQITFVDQFSLTDAIKVIPCHLDFKHANFLHPVSDSEGSDCESDLCQYHNDYIYLREASHNKYNIGEDEGYFWMRSYHLTLQPARCIRLLLSLEMSGQ